MPDLLRVLLGPVLLAQGKRLYTTIPDLPEAPGERDGTRGSGPPLKVLIVGDSSGAGVGAPSQDEALLGQVVSRLAESREVTYKLIARKGSTIPRTLRHLRNVPPEEFDVAVTAIGMNDITGGRDLEPWLASYARLADELRERFRVRHIVSSGMPPIGEFPAIPNPLRWYLGKTGRRYDRALAAWTQTQPDVSRVDFHTHPGDRLYGVSVAEMMASDGFHPGPRIYDLWGERVAQAILAHASASPA